MAIHTKEPLTPSLILISVGLAVTSVCFMGLGVAGGVGFLRSIVDPEAEWTPVVGGLMVFILFGGVGVGIAALTIAAGRMHFKEAKARKEFPNAPWFWKDEWRQGVVRHSPWSQVWFWMCIAIFWNTMFVGFCILMLLDGALTQKPGVLLIISPFLVIGCWLFSCVFRAVRTAIGLGISHLHLETVPLVPGRTMRACIVFERANRRPNANAAKTLVVSLSCSRKKVHTPNIHLPFVGKVASDEDIVYEQPLFEKSLLVEQQPNAASDVNSPLGFSFDIPVHARGSTDEQPLEWQIWIDRTSKHNDIPFGHLAEYAIPVFEANRQGQTFDLPEYDNLARRMTFEEIVARAGGRLCCESPDRLKLEFRHVPLPAGSLGRGILIVFWLIASLGVLTQAIWIGIVFLVIGFSIAWNHFLESKKYTIIDVSAGNLKLERNGWRNTEKTWRLSSIKSVAAVSAPKHERMVETVILEDRAGERHHLLEDLPSRYYSHAIAKQLWKACSSLSNEPADLAQDD